MNNLPLEVLYKIFKPLHQLDKTECLLVCRSWKKVIENTVLFTTIRLHSNEQLDKVVDKMRLEPQNSDRVERLIIDIKDIRSPEIDILSFLFSNIREIILREKFENQDLQFTKALTNHPWKKTIKVIREASSHVLTKHILRGDQCPILTEIYISSGNGNSGQLIELLVNAPNLKILKLWNTDIALRDLETLHDNLPLLNTLLLNSSKINSDALPASVKPATLMDSLTLHNASVSTSDKCINLYKYLALKYKNLTQMMYSIRSTDGSRFNPEEMMKIGLRLQLKEIGPFLTVLKMVDTECIQYLFPVLDQNKCQLKEFSIYGPMNESLINYISASNQAKSIQTLSLSGIEDDEFLKHLSKLTALTELKLKYKPDSGGDTDLNILLEAVGKTLITLKLSQTSITFDRSFVPKYPRLNKLILEKSDIPEQGDFFLSEAFPHLRTFIIDDCTWDLRMFYLDNMNLSRLELRDPLTPDDKYVLISTLCNGEKRWYTANQVSILNKHPSNDPFACPAMKSLPFDQFNGLPYTTFICKSLDTFFLINTFTK